MNRKPSLLPIALGAVLALATSVAFAAVDPDLVILDAKVKGVSAGIPSLGPKVGVVAVQLTEQFNRNETGLLGLGDARARSLEAVLLACAMDPTKCLPPNLQTSSLDPRCLVVVPLAPSVAPSVARHTHDTGFACPLQEILTRVKKDRDAAEAGGLVRNYADADRHLAAAETARLAADSWTAFQEACAAFKDLACPK